MAVINKIQLDLPIYDSGTPAESKSKKSSARSSKEPHIKISLPNVKKLSEKDLALALASEDSDEDEDLQPPGPKRGTKSRSIEVNRNEESDNETAFERPSRLTRGNSRAPLSPKNSRIRSSGRVSIPSRKIVEATEKENLPPVKKTPVKQSRRTVADNEAGLSPEKRMKMKESDAATAPVTPSSVVVKRLQSMSLEDGFVRTPTVNAYYSKPETVPSLKIKVKDLFGNVKLPERGSPMLKPETPLLRARTLLHAAAVPNSLPCREQEFAEIYAFADTHIQNGTGG